MLSKVTEGKDIMTLHFWSVHVARDILHKIIAPFNFPLAKR